MFFAKGVRLSSFPRISHEGAGPEETQVHWNRGSHISEPTNSCVICLRQSIEVIYINKKKKKKEPKEEKEMS